MGWPRDGKGLPRNRNIPQLPLFSAPSELSRKRTVVAPPRASEAALRRVVDEPLRRLGGAVDGVLEQRAHPAEGAVHRCSVVPLDDGEVARASVPALGPSPLSSTSRPAAHVDAEADGGTAAAL